MEIHSTIQFRLILPHIPGFQQMPLPTPVCSHSLECNGCPPRFSLLEHGRDLPADTDEQNQQTGEKANCCKHF